MNGNAPKILTVDDDPDIRKSVALWLGGEGYEVVAAENGLDGLRMVVTEKPDVVLLDLRMPVLDGYGFLERLSEAADPPPPVLVFSGAGDVAGVVESFRLGAFDFISKPIVNFSLLTHAIQNALERKTLDRKAAKAEQRYFNLVQNLPLVVFVLRRDFRLEFINKRLTDMLGYSRVEVFDDKDWLLGCVHPEDREEAKRTLIEAFSSPEKVFSLECRLIRKDGGLAHAILKSMPSSLGPEDGEAEFLEGILMDITERVELEKFLVQEEKLKTLGAISAEVAHEIRNPLFSIAGFARRLRDKAPEFKETDIILSEAERLEAMLNKISDYLHPVEMRPRPCSLNDAARAALELLAPETAGRRNALSLALEAQPPQVVQDPDLLAQAVINLVQYALAHAAGDGPALVSTHSDAHFSRLEITYRPGVAVSDPEILFLPFEEAKDNRGLPLARRLIKNMGGALTYETGRDRGTFVISLPLSEAT